MITLSQVRRDRQARTLVTGAERHLKVLGYTEHGLRHAGVVSRFARRLLTELNRPQEIIEAGAIAGWLHDIGNVVAREGHGVIGGMLSMDILNRLGMSPDYVTMIAGAIGNHEDGEGHPVNDIAAALILADKADVRRTRVRKLTDSPDIHDRVNYAVEKRQLRVDVATREIKLLLTVDDNISPVMEYFEIFLLRMIMCRRAATFLNCSFHLSINDTRIL